MWLLLLVFVLVVSDVVVLGVFLSFSRGFSVVLKFLLWVFCCSKVFVVGFCCLSAFVVVRFFLCG